MTIDQETRLRAEELYVIDGMTIAEVAAELEINERTLQNWSVEGGWKAKRREYRDAAGEIQRYTTLTKLKLIKDAMISLDPQKVYAFAALEKATQSSDLPLNPLQRGTDGNTDGTGLESRPISTPQEAVNALQDAIEMKLRGMLAQPGAINLGAIKDLKQAMGLLDEMKMKYAAKDDRKDRLLSDEEIKSIREQVL